MKAKSISRGRRSVTSWAIALALSACIVVLGAGSAGAQTCVAGNAMANSAGLNRFRIHVASFDALAGVSRDEVVTAAIRGAEVWNELGNAGYFQYMGSTNNLGFLPANNEDCDAVPESTILVDDTNCDGTRTALVLPRCRDSSGKFHAWHIIVFKFQGTGGQCFEVQHTVSTPTVHDLVGTFAHEFGHTLGLDHPTSGFNVMRAPQPIGGTTNQRELAEYDIRCLDQLAGYRNGSDFRRYHITGSLRPEQSMVQPFTSYLSVGLTRLSGAWEHSVAFKSFGAVKWNRNFIPSTNSTIAGWRVIGPVAANWLEDPSRDRIFYSSGLEVATDFGWGKHPLQQVHSTDGFQTNRVYGSLDEYGVGRIHTGRPVALAWDDYNDKTAFVWVNQTRSDGPDDREVRVSVGHTGNMQINTSDTLGVRSSVTPGIACQAFQAGSYDCILAYVPHEDTHGEVFIHRFWAHLNGRQTVLHIDPTGPRWLMGNTRTASRIAAWRHDGLFWVAIRPMRSGGQEIEVFSSPDGASWTWHGRFGPTAIGPSAVSMPITVNVLAHSR
ncbi:MAG: hypothetical protein ACE5I9_05145 [Candidatus Methylomirabilales bacterium]